MDGGADEGAGRRGDEVSGDEVSGVQGQGAEVRRTGWRGRGRVVRRGDGGVAGVELGMMVQMEGMVRCERG